MQRLLDAPLVAKPGHSFKLLILSGGSVSVRITQRNSVRLRGLYVEHLETRRLMAFDPTASEQELMQLANRFRTDPRGEFSRLIASVSPRRAYDTSVNDALTFFNTNVSIVQSELAVLNPVAPLGWDESAQRMAQDYLPFLAAAKRSSHTLDGTVLQRFNRYGFNVSGGAAARENIFIGATSPVQTHAAYVIDWGSGPNGLQASTHRNNLMNSDLKFAGMAFATVPHEPGVIGPMINVQEIIGLGVTPPMVTGAVFQDTNGSRWYEAGEGKGGVQIKFEGPAGTFTVQTMTAGGYNAKIPAGTYTATASGGGLRFPISKTNVVLGTQNVWLNFLYDPTAVPQDAYESNNSLATATLLSGLDQTLSGGTIHASDVDYFRLPANTTGPLKVDLRFANSVGNLGLHVLDSNGNTLASSLTASDLESISLNITRGRTYYIKVDATGGGTGGPYTLSVDLPPAQAPSGRADVYTLATTTTSTVLPVLSNDVDPDGDLQSSRLQLVVSAMGTAQVVTSGSTQAISYRPLAGYSGIDRFQYIITDAQGLNSEPISVEVMVVNLAAPRPFQNTTRSFDVSGDATITAIDVLLVLNQINLRSGGELPTSAAQLGNVFGFVDVNGNGMLEPLDALLVINQLNNPGGGEGESAELPEDWALIDIVQEFQPQRRRNR